LKAALAKNTKLTKTKSVLICVTCAQGISGYTPLRQIFNQTRRGLEAKIQKFKFFLTAFIVTT